MPYLNFFGLGFMIVIMIPNIVCAIKTPDAFRNRWSNRLVEVLEQIGRIGCFAFMVVILPATDFGFASDELFALYLIIASLLVIAYCLIWLLCFRRQSLFRALALSILPSLLFLLSAIFSHYWPLLIFALLFAPTHIAISYKNAVLAQGEDSRK